MGQIPFDLDSLHHLQMKSIVDGCFPVVGALIANHEGRIFIQKRSANRALFPSAWDIAGGHVEQGETLIEALGREVREETGWELHRILALVKVFDWQSGPRGKITYRREFDFLVEVQGDLSAPALEADRFTAYRWLSEAELPVLEENRAGDNPMRDLLAEAFKQMRQNQNSGVS